MKYDFEYCMKRKCKECKRIGECDSNEKRNNKKNRLNSTQNVDLIKSIDSHCKD